MFILKKNRIEVFFKFKNKILVNSFALSQGESGCHIVIYINYKTFSINCRTSVSPVTIISYYLYTNLSFSWRMYRHNYLIFTTYLNFTTNL